MPETCEREHATSYTTSSVAVDIRVTVVLLVEEEKKCQSPWDDIA